MKHFNLFSQNSFPLKVLLNHHSIVGLHDHDFYELVLVISGEGLHISGEERHPISAGDIFLIKPGNPHGYEGEHHFSVYNILYLPEKLALPRFDLAQEPGFRAFFELAPELRRQFGFRKHFRLGKTQLDEFALLSERIKQELESSQSGHYFRAVTLFMRLIERVSHACGNSAVYRENDALLRLGTVVTFMEQHQAESLTIKELADRAAMSPATLNRAFRRAVGKSPLNYLNELRIANAEQLLLANPALSIAEIALRCGFSDSNYFSRLFKKRTNRTPRAFRKDNKGCL
ncbi:MAG: helix-turn-helix domain-containing protein [Victivallales bacterium]|jgi:AraC family L-rhamnose operon transcriptional activator RhaR/AraC family L-rhamnose operon regulatory protein RhaS|nr:helix-turn-helix domain-containing protein [Victivallales bacterium]